MDNVAFRRIGYLSDCIVLIRGFDNEADVVSASRGHRLHIEALLLSQLQVEFQRITLTGAIN